MLRRYQIMLSEPTHTGYKASRICLDKPASKSLIFCVKIKFNLGLFSYTGAWCNGAWWQHTRLWICGSWFESRRPSLERVERSPKGEYYLTDLAGIAVADGLRVEALVAEDPHEALGINTREHLAEAEAVMRQRTNHRWMEAGVTIVDPHTTYIDADVEIGIDSILYPGTHLLGNTILGPGCKVGPNAVIANSRLGVACRVAAAWIENSALEDHVHVNAFLYVRGEHILSSTARENTKVK
jgi:hypothetical protein